MTRSARTTRPFSNLTEKDLDRLFHLPPVPDGQATTAEKLAARLGATLYTPGTRRDLAGAISRSAERGVTSMVLCLEDAIPDAAVTEAQTNVIETVRELSAADDGKALPHLFVRVRSAGQLLEIVDQTQDVPAVLTGFVAPKFTSSSGPAYLEAIACASARAGRQLFLMPVLETAEVVYAESRMNELMKITSLLNQSRDAVLAVRVGGTDIAGLFGLRRGRDVTCYDIGPVRDAIAAMVNTFVRTDGSGFPLTGCVWEYYRPSERVFRPQLRVTPFARSQATSMRHRLVGADLDGLVREVVLDKANGLIGKTVIHPTHVPIVHALLAVTHEEWEDAVSVRSGGGAQASTYGNKMNESNPHAKWSVAVMDRAEAFGVLAEQVTFADLLIAATEPDDHSARRA